MRLLTDGVPADDETDFGGFAATGLRFTVSEAAAELTVMNIVHNGNVVARVHSNGDAEFAGTVTQNVAL